MLYKKAAENAQAVKARFGGSFDLAIREFGIGGKPAAAVFLDGMCDEMKITESIIKPLTDEKNFSLFESREQAIRQTAFKGLGLKEIGDAEDAAHTVTEGNFVLFLENGKTAFAFSMQGFPKKAVSEPQAEMNERGSGESFCDSFKDNAALLRRRLKTPELAIEQTVVGKTSHTDVLLCYLTNRADPKMVDKIRRRLRKTGLDNLPGSGCLKPFFSGGAPTLFSDTGFTERPDMLAAKLCEGRVGVIADGSPFALIVPYLFIDYFHALDDYMSAPLYALFIRALRILCFLVSAVLPGLFVATCNFHPEVLPPNIMPDIAAAEARTPFSLMFEAVAIHLIYEIVREASLRMPVAVGSAVSIVGALVVGDAAVTAGLIAAPMLMVVALTAISSAVVSKLHESLALIRFAMILLGGLTGFFGIFAAGGLLLADICGAGAFGVPFSAPFTPWIGKEQSDALRRDGWRKLARRRQSIKELELG